MKVFRVEVSKEMYVLAEDFYAAEAIAIENVDDEISEWGAHGHELKSVNEVPADERECRIWCEGDEEITIAEAFEGKRP